MYAVARVGEGGEVTAGLFCLELRPFGHGRQRIAYVSDEFPQNRPIQTDNKYFTAVNTVPRVYTTKRAFARGRRRPRFRQKNRRKRTSTVERRYPYKKRTVLFVFQQIFRMFRSPTPQICAEFFLRTVGFRPVRYLQRSLLLLRNCQTGKKKKKNTTRTHTHPSYSMEIVDENRLRRTVFYSTTMFEYQIIFAVLVI